MFLIPTTWFRSENATDYTEFHRRSVHGKDELLIWYSRGLHVWWGRGVWTSSTRIVYLFVNCIDLCKFKYLTCICHKSCWLFCRSSNESKEKRKVFTFFASSNAGDQIYDVMRQNVPIELLLVLGNTIILFYSGFEYSVVNLFNCHYQ